MTSTPATSKALVPLSGSVLAWAVQEGGYTVDSLAERLKVDASELEDRMSGEQKPDRSQFRCLAEVLRRPTAVFFLSEPPDIPSVGAAYRAAPGSTRLTADIYSHVLPRQHQAAVDQLGAALDA